MTRGVMVQFADPKAKGGWRDVEAFKTFMEASDEYAIGYNKEKIRIVELRECADSASWLRKESGMFARQT